MSTRIGFVAAIAMAVSFAACGGGSKASSGPSGTLPTPTPAPTGPPNPSGWVAEASSPLSPTNARHDDIFFLDRNKGWLINARAEVWGTEDGGESWTKLVQLANDVFLRTVGFASTTLGWAGNLNITAGNTKADYSLWETVDGGHTWANISSRISGATVIGLCGMRVLSPSTAVAVGRWGGPAVFVKTTDGGKTWTSRTLSPQVTGIVDLTFLNPQQGFAVGGIGVGYSEAEQRSSRTVILGTNDGGETWTTRYTSTTTGEWAWKVQFVDDQTGYVTTEGPTPSGVILKTVDGGASWRPFTVSPGLGFEAVGFVSATRGFVGSFPTIYQTTDGAATWTPLNFGVRVNRMRVLGPDLIYASGDRVYRWTP